MCYDVSRAIGGNMRVLRLGLAIVVMCGIMQISSASGGSVFKLQKIGECKRAVPQNQWYKNCWTLGDVMVESQITNDAWDCRIYATDVKTCKRLWERELDCADTTGVVREGDRLYLINTQFTRERAFSNANIDIGFGGSPSIQCFDIKTGKKIWIDSFRRGTTRISVPVIIGDLVYAGFGNIFYAFRKSDGKEVWHYSSNDHLMTTLFGQMNTETEIFTFGGKATIYWGNDYFSLHCLDAKTGRLKWKYDRVGNRKDYRTNEGVELAIERIVDFSFDQSTICLRLIKQPKLYDIQTTYSILALDRSTGKILWEIEDFDNNFKYDFRNTIFTSNRCLFAKQINANGKTSEIRTYDTYSGKFIRKLNTTSFLYPSASENQVYIINYKGIEAVRFPEGKRVWYRPVQFLQTAEQVKYFNYSDNIVEQDSKLFAQTENGLFCIDSKTGKLADSWNYKINPSNISRSGKNTIACEIKNGETDNNTMLLFQY